MKKIIKISFIALIILLCALSSNVNAKVKENPSLFTTDTYVIGSTKFDNGFVITASRAAIAGADEAYIQYNIYGNIEFGSTDIVTYYYCALDNSWSEVKENGGGLRELEDTEVQVLEESLNIFFVNNIEKRIEIPFSDSVDNGSVNSQGARGEAKVENNKISIPATWMVNGFSFTSEGSDVNVTLSELDDNNESQELETPIIKKIVKPTLATTIPIEVQVGEEVEFTIDLNANSYENEPISNSYINLYYTGSATQTVNPIDKFEYFDTNTNTWVSILNNQSAVIGSTLQTKQIKCRAVFTLEGTYSLNTTLNCSNAFVQETKTITAIINPNAVAKAEYRYFENIQDAVASIENSGAITLLKDITLAERLNISKEISINLDGHTISIEGNVARITAKDNAVVSIHNGTIKNGEYALQAQDNAHLNVESDVNIFANGYGIAVWDSAEVNFNGNITVYGDAFGITGCGDTKTQGETNTIINVFGTITAEEGGAIYHPQIGTLNIYSGAILKGKSIVGMKAGTLNVYGGTLEATGEKKAPVQETGRWSNYTGDVIYIEENPNYKDNIKVYVAAGTLTSANGYKIQEFNPTIGTEKELTAEVTGLYENKIQVEGTTNTFYYEEIQ